MPNAVQYGCSDRRHFHLAAGNIFSLSEKRETTYGCWSSILSHSIILTLSRSHADTHM